MAETPRQVRVRDTWITEDREERRRAPRDGPMRGDMMEHFNQPGGNGDLSRYRGTNRDAHNTSPPAMDAVEIARIVWRRWYIALTGVALTTAAVFGVVQGVDPTYESVGSFLVAGPSLRGEGFDDAGAVEHLVTAAEVAAELSTEESRAALTHGDMASTTYTLTPSADGSIMNVEAVASRPVDAVETAKSVLHALHLELARRQAAVGATAMGQSASRTLSGPTDEESVTERLVTDATTGQAEIRYVATGAVLIIEPTRGLDNPYASSSFTIRVIDEVLSNPLVYWDVVGDRDSEYSIDQMPRDAAPVLYVTAAGHNLSDVQATFNDVVDRVRLELDERQEVLDIAPARRVTLEPLSVPPYPEVSNTNLKRPTAAVAGLGLFATIAVAVVIDRVLDSRKRRIQLSEVSWDHEDQPTSTVKGPAGS